MDLDLYFGILLDSEIQQLLEFLNTITPSTAVKNLYINFKFFFKIEIAFLEVLKERILLKLHFNDTKSILDRTDFLAKITTICAKLPTNPELSIIAGRYAQILTYYFCQLDKNHKRKRKFYCITTKKVFFF